MLVKNGVKLSLKLFNSAMGMGGIATVMYGVFMFRAWQLQGGNSSFHHIPWFFHDFLGIGIALCALTCLGHIAANTPNFSCLYVYIILLLCLLILETLIMAGAFANPNWEKELPIISPSNWFDGFYMDFVGPGDLIWLAWSVFLIQAICVLLATLRIQQTNDVDSHESEEEEEEDQEP